MQKLVSVIIPTYNSLQYICKAIDSVLAQTYKNIEIIVVDDGSTDDTMLILKKYESKIAIISQANRGPSIARNVGIVKAKGDYITFLDSDDLWLPEKLEKQIDFIKANPNVKFVNCCAAVYNMKTDKNEKIPKLNYPKKILLKKLLIKNCVGDLPGWFIAKECFDKVGLFDETLAVAEDWDLALRICREFEYGVVDEPLIVIQQREGSQSYFGSKNLENELRFLNKIFSSKEINADFLIKGKTYSYRYFCAAWAYYSQGDLNNALKKILVSFLCFPLDFMNKNQGGLMIKIIIKKLLSVGVPVNRFSKPLFFAVYNIHVFLREFFIWFLRFFYYEPLFRSQCEKIGYGLWMEQLPYIVGKGIICIGNNVRLSGIQSFGFSSKMYSDPKITIGDSTFIGHDTSFAIAKEIIIGKNCFIAGGVTISDNDGHPLDAKKRREHMPPEKDDVKAVTIGDDVWIGRQAMILKGVSIGNGAVIGARSIVVKDVSPNTVVAGNPAKNIKTLE